VRQTDHMETVVPPSPLPEYLKWADRQSLHSTACRFYEQVPLQAVHHAQERVLPLLYVGERIKWEDMKTGKSGGISSVGFH
jgi:hypothetical protein